MSYPAYYQKFCRYEKLGGTASKLGFAGSNEDVFRFCNRFRLAKAFDSMSAPGYNARTLSAYSVSAVTSNQPAMVEMTQPL
jgi:hypothetical protein